MSRHQYGIFCACFSDVISRGSQWWRLEMSAVFSGEPGKQYFRHNTAAPLPMLFAMLFTFVQLQKLG